MTIGAADGAADPLAGARATLRTLLLDHTDTGLVRAVASGRQRNTVAPFRRVEVRYVDLKAGRRLQVVSYDDTQAHTRNVELGRAAEAAVDELLAEPYASWHIRAGTETTQLRVTKKGRPLLHRAPTEDGAGDVDRSHDRAKHRRLDGADPLFQVLGIADERGRIKPTKVAKFRQVQDLLGVLSPLVDDVVSLGPGADLSDERPVRLVDLGCGNAYLTFAAYRYLTVVRELPVMATGIDVKAQAREHNTEVAHALGISDHFRFLEGGIGDAQVTPPPDVVVALHACDTATDDALARAVTWETPVILAAPCCHHDIQRQLSADHTPAGYRLVMRHGILRERFADVLTDALRAAILRLVGYRVEVVEFVDSQHTPRNALIRAVRTGVPAPAEVVAAYSSLVADWGVRPALADRLAGRHPLLAAPAAAPGDTGGP